jgi:hypothetical protein
MFRNAETRKQIVIGIVVSLIFAGLVQPFLGWIWNLLNSATGALAASVTDLIHRRAAGGMSERYAFSILTLINGMLVGPLAVGSIAAFFVPKFLFAERGERSHQTTAEEIADIRLRLEKSRRRIKTLLIPLRVMMPTCLALLIFVAVIDTGIYRLNRTFEHTLAALAPEMDDLQLKKYRSRWALMSSRADYELIHRDLMKLASDRRIKLPEHLTE